MKRGFTLIELLVVMAIIGMLTSIVAVAMSGIQAKSRDTRRIEDVSGLKKALALYYIDTNAFPSAPSAVTLSGSDTITTALVSAGTISSFSGDPVSPAYEYTYQSVGVSTYTITFCLETDSIPNHAQGCSNTVSP